VRSARRAGESREIGRPGGLIVRDSVEEAEKLRDPSRAGLVAQPRVDGALGLAPGRQERRRSRGERKDLLAAVGGRGVTSTLAALSARRRSPVTPATATARQRFQAASPGQVGRGWQPGRYTNS
jgi:hypothetical protein